MGNIIERTRPFSFETVTVADTAISLTAGTYTTAIRAVISVETATLRYRVDGTAPTASVGHIANDGDVIILESSIAISNFQAIRTTGTSASISATYER